VRFRRALPVLLHVEQARDDLHVVPRPVVDFPQQHLSLFLERLRLLHLPPEIRRPLLHPLLELHFPHPVPFSAGAQEHPQQVAEADCSQDAAGISQGRHPLDDVRPDERNQKKRDCRGHQVPAARLREPELVGQRQSYEKKSDACKISRSCVDAGIDRNRNDHRDQNGAGPPRRS